MPIQTYKKTKPLNSSLEDFIITRLEFDDKSKKVVGFCVLQIYAPGDATYEIIRFDTSHGFCHVHRFYRELGIKGQKMHNVEVSQAGFNKCRTQIKENWKKYKKLYLGKWLK